MMKISKIFAIFTFLNLFYIFNLSSVFSQTFYTKLLGDFEKGWEKHWIERKLSDKSTHYEVIQEDTNLVLMAKSDQSASGLWRMLNIHPVQIGKISWRWKIAYTLSKKNEEKDKLGDDYAARLFVVFTPHMVSWKTRAICYVWAANEPKGSIYKNPYAHSVGTIVVESGNTHKSKWITEERDFIADYIKIFGKAPEMVTAVAIMVDTDNTAQKATAWFDDIILECGILEKETETSEMQRIKIKF